MCRVATAKMFLNGQIRSARHRTSKMDTMALSKFKAVLSFKKYLEPVLQCSVNWRRSDWLLAEVGNVTGNTRGCFDAHVHNVAKLQAQYAFMFARGGMTNLADHGTLICNFVSLKRAHSIVHL